VFAAAAVVVVVAAAGVVVVVVLLALVVLVVPVRQLWIGSEAQGTSYSMVQIAAMARMCYPQVAGTFSCYP